MLVCKNCCCSGASILLENFTPNRSLFGIKCNLNVYWNLRPTSSVYLGLHTFVKNFVTISLHSRLISTSINQSIKIINQMSFFRVLLAILFPPLAVIGKGCGSIIIVFLLTLCGWVPGVIAALVILNNPN